MSDIWTHVGVIRGANATTPENYRRTVRLRETKRLWISEDGLRWDKRWGGPSPKQQWPRTRLDLESIRAAANGEGSR